MAQQRPRVNRRLAQKDLTQDPRRLRWWRHAAGLTVEELGRRVGRSKGSISMWETGRRSCDVLSLSALAEALGCKNTDLMPPLPGTTRQRGATGPPSTSTNGVAA